MPAFRSVVVSAPPTPVAKTVIAPPVKASQVTVPAPTVTAGGGGNPTVIAAGGFESGSPRACSPFVQWIAHNGDNPTDTTRNFGNAVRLNQAGAGHAPDTGLWLWRNSLYGPEDSTWYHQATNQTIASAHLDRAEVSGANTKQYPAGTHSWYTMALWMPSFPANLWRGWGTTNGNLIVSELNYHFNGNGPLTIELRGISPGFTSPKLTMVYNTGWNQQPTSPAYQYNSDSGFGFPGGAVPDTDILGGNRGGSMALNAWNRLIIHVYWSTGTDGLIEVWNATAPSVPGASSTPDWSYTGVATVQWPKSQGTTLTNTQYNTINSGALISGADNIGPYRGYSLSPLSPNTWYLDIDTFDSTGYSSDMTSLANARKRWL